MTTVNMKKVTEVIVGTIITSLYMYWLLVCIFFLSSPHIFFAILSGAIVWIISITFMYYGIKKIYKL